MKIVKNNLYMLSMLWKAAPVRVLLEIIIFTLNRMESIVFSVFLMRMIMKAIENSLTMAQVFPVIFILLIYEIIVAAYGGWFFNVYMPKSDVVIQEYFLSKVYEKAVECDLECYENPDFYNKYTRANSELLMRGGMVLENIANAVSSITGMVICTVIIMHWEPIVVPIVIFCGICAMLIDKKRSAKGYDAQKKATPDNRAFDYVKRTLYLSDYAKEMRIGNMYFPLMTYFENSLKSMLKIFHKEYSIIGLLRCVREIFMSLGTFLGVQGIILYRYITYHAYNLSDFVTIINAANTLIGRIYSFTWVTSEFMDNGLYAENIREFLEYKPKIKEDENGLDIKNRQNSLTLKNVSFRYSEQKADVLKNINIDIPHGSKIAFVGHNGAGKSTLVKLLMRLYDVSDGEILLDGENIKKYKLSKYRKIFSTVFQDFKIFAASITENILLHPAENENDENTALQAAKDSGLYRKVSGMKNGMDTLLTKEFDDNGVLMSGGEFQKIAVSRVFADKSSTIAILDEPSSALDPISEYEIFENMMKACGDKTIIFISHRMSTAVLADRIYMLENGSVIEEGSHKELMERNGKYAEMFRMQSEKYQGGEEEDE